MNKISKIELEVENYIKELGVKYEHNNRTILKTKLHGYREIDFFLFEIGIGIEVDGDYYHNNNFGYDPLYITSINMYSFLKRLSKHKIKCKKTISKFALALDNNVFIYHIYEFEWNDEELQKKVKNDIKNIVSNLYNNFDLSKDKHIVDVGKQNYIYLLQNGYEITWFRLPQIVYKNNNLDVYNCGTVIMKKSDSMQKK